MKIQGMVTEDGGELRWVSPAGRELKRTIASRGSHGEDLAALRATASKIAEGYMVDHEFEIVDSFEPAASSSGPDPRLSSAEHLRQRRAAGEHLCFFCTHETICAVQVPLRANTPALIVISGCGQFAPVGQVHGG